MLAVAGFAAFEIGTQRRAARLLEAEAEAVVLLRTRAAAGATPDVVHATGYEFRWDFEKGQTPLLVARPEVPGRSGNRWFATDDGEEIFEFDPTAMALATAGPPLRSLREFVDLRPDKRTKRNPAHGWRSYR